jgi:V8-like Glu-specific endopeptidase
MRNWYLLATAFAAISCGDNRGSNDLQSIYGTDDRKEVHEAEQLWRTAARSVVALVKQEKINANRLTGDSLGSKLNLCESERFRDQPSVAGCSGFLAAPDVIITSGHCIKTTADCADTRFVFDYALLTPGHDPLSAAATQNVYQCARIISRQHGGQDKNDYAVIKLDRAVSGRQPLQLSNNRIADMAQVVSIGTPSGLPLKVMVNGRVLKNQDPTFFEVNLDSFGGNSGGPVLNATTGLVEGIVVRGREDYNIEGACTTAYVYPENADSGEDVTRASILLSAMRGGGTNPSPLPPEPQPPAPAPPTPPWPSPQPPRPAPGLNVNLHADMTYVARLSFEIADLAEDVSRRTSGTVQNVATDLHYAASTMYRAAMRISRSNSWGQERMREMEDFVAYEYQSVSQKLNQLFRSTGLNPYISNSARRMDERMKDISDELLRLH